MDLELLFYILGMLSTNSNSQNYILPRTSREIFTNIVFTFHCDLSPTPPLNITENFIALFNIVRELSLLTIVKRHQLQKDLIIN